MLLRLAYVYTAIMKPNRDWSFDNNKTLKVEQASLVCNITELHLHTLNFVFLLYGFKVWIFRIF